MLRTAGDYRISFGTRRGAPELQVAVLRGQADVVNSYGRTALRAGTEGLTVDGRAPSVPYPINSALGDSFDRWVDTIRAERLGSTSSPYLPADLRVYGGAFDQYGSWDYLPDYGGHVWYPRVSVGWRPYSVGRWSFYGNFGWFWVGAGRWSWPTHHYGRWGMHANRWYWVPDRRWAPAWVAWGGAPGYTSWCPLGFDGRPVIGFSSVRYADPWSAWTVVPTRVFANNIVVSRHVVNYRGIAPNVRSQFEVRHAPAGGVYGQVVRAQPLRAPTAGRTFSREGARTGPSRDVGQSVSTPAGRSRSGGLTATPPSRSIDVPRDRAAAPFDRAQGGPSAIDQSTAQSRSRIPTRDGAARSTPPRLEAPPRPDSQRLEPPALSMPSSPRAQPRSRTIDDGRSSAPASELPSTRSYRSRESQPTPDDARPSRTYRSRDTGSAGVSAPDRGASIPSRPMDRSTVPSDRGRAETPAMRSRPSSGDAPRTDAPSRVESRPPPSDGARSAPPSRTAPDNRGSDTRSSSGRGGGQAVRRGGGV